MRRPGARPRHASAASCCCCRPAITSSAARWRWRPRSCCSRFVPAGIGRAAGARAAAARHAAGAQPGPDQPRRLPAALRAARRRPLRQPRSARQSAAADDLDALVGRHRAAASAPRQSLGLHQSVDRALPPARPPDRRPHRPAPPLAYPAWLGYWPADRLLLRLRLVRARLSRAGRSRSGWRSPSALYWLVAFAGMLALRREAWLERAEPFSIFFRLIAGLSPLADRAGAGRQPRRSRSRSPGAALLGARAAAALRHALRAADARAPSPSTACRRPSGGWRSATSTRSNFPAAAPSSDRNTIGLLLAFAVLAVGLLGGGPARLDRSPACGSALAPALGTLRLFDHADLDRLPLLALPDGAAGRRPVRADRRLRPVRHRPRSPRPRPTRMSRRRSSTPMAACARSGTCRPPAIVLGHVAAIAARPRAGACAISATGAAPSLSQVPLAVADGALHAVRALASFDAGRRVRGNRTRLSIVGPV